MWRLVFLAVLLTGCLCFGSATAHEFQGELTLRNFARINEPMLTYAGSRIQTRYEHHTKNYNVYAEGRFRWNGVFMGTTPYSEQARDAYEFSFDLREGYVQVPIAGFDWSVGWQQVVWGKADQLRILDQINPLDLREFVLLDMKDYRKPVPMIRLNKTINKWEGELLYIPRFDPFYLAVSGSEYDMHLIPDTPGVVELPTAQYNSVGQGAESGLRLSRSFQKFDLSLVALYTRDATPVLSQSFYGDPNNPYLGLRKEYHRYFMSGTSFSLPVANAMVMRGEFSYIPARTFMLDTVSEGNGLERHGEVATMIALDYTYEDWLFSIQALNRNIIDWQPQLINAHNTATLTVSAQGTSFSSRLDTRVFIATIPFTGDGAWFQLKNTYSFDDHFSSSLIVDVLQGPKKGFFGQFNDRDRVGLELSYRF